MIKYLRMQMLFASMLVVFVLDIETARSQNKVTKATWVLVCRCLTLGMWDASDAAQAAQVDSPTPPWTPTPAGIGH